MGIGKWISDKTKAIAASITGRDKFEQANAHYDQIYTEYEAAKKQYKATTDQQNQQLFNTIEKINLHKQHIQVDLFADFVEMLSILKDVEIPEDFSEEVYTQQCRKLDTFQKIKTRDSLLAIDFDRDKLKTALQSIFTLGIYTRKKAKESLDNVEQQCLILKNEMSEMNSEIANQKALVCSAEQIEHYFEKMSSLFEQWMRYMEHAIHYIAYAAMRINKQIPKHSVSISLLHETQQKELEATITLGKVLSKMIQFQLVITQKNTNLPEYEKQMKTHYETFEAHMAA